jgi:hypothetical protein
MSADFIREGGAADPTARTASKFASRCGNIIFDASRA